MSAERIDESRRDALIFRLVAEFELFLAGMQGCTGYDPKAHDDPLFEEFCALVGLTPQEKARLKLRVDIEREIEGRR